MPPVDNVHVGVAAIIRYNGKILLIQRGGRENYADGYGTWGLPGGWLELNESPFEAAIRETKEETGLDVNPVNEDGFTWNMSSDGLRSITTLFIVCEYLGGVPTNPEPEKQLTVSFINEELLVELDLFRPLHLWWRRPR